jgi:eukaryotic-like serine/threonine-protein kinase
MGSSSGFADETPQIKVYLDAFWIDRTEVTNKMYATCVSSGTCSPPKSDDSTTRSSYYNSDTYADYPIINVDWNQAHAYCN